MMKEENVVTTQSQSQTQWVDTIVQAAQTANKMFAQNTCRLCHVYTDKQVEFETRNEISSSPLESIFMRTAEASMEVELYKQFLFDEESVNDNVTDRMTTDGKSHSTGLPYNSNHNNSTPDFLTNEHFQRVTQVHHKDEDMVSTFTQNT
jgi:hypothetical protein